MERRRQIIELIIGVALLVAIVAGGILLSIQKKGKTNSDNASADVVRLESEIANLNKKIDDLNKSLSAIKSASTETATASAVSDSGAQIPLGKVNINTASLSELDSLPGIGPTYAQRIIDYRNNNGGFKSIDELKNVKGIGDKTFDKFKESVTI